LYSCNITYILFPYKYKLIAGVWCSDSVEFCTDPTGPCAVTGLDLSNYNLRGALPLELGNLSDLGECLSELSIFVSVSVSASVSVSVSVIEPK
jgi:hypothetical protein